MNNLPNNKTKLISEVAEKFSSFKFSRILIIDTLKKSNVDVILKIELTI